MAAETETTAGPPPAPAEGKRDGIGGIQPTQLAPPPPTDVVGDDRAPSSPSVSRAGSPLSLASTGSALLGAEVLTTGDMAKVRCVPLWSECVS